MGRILRSSGYSMIAGSVIAALLGASSAPAIAAGHGCDRGGDGDLTSIGRLLGVDGASATDGWAVGDVTVDGVSSTLIQRWNGVAWQQVDSPNPGGSHGTTLTAVTALAADDAWAVGSFGAVASGKRSLILHWDGVSWTKVSSPNPSALGDNTLS